MRVLGKLSDLGFPAPAPLPAFAGSSWAVAGGQLWQVVSFIPGEVVGWDGEPGLHEIGALLGRFHLAARQIGVAGQRPAALPLADVPPILLSPQLEAAGVGAERASAVRTQAESLARDLAAARARLASTSSFMATSPGTMSLPLGSRAERPASSTSPGRTRSARSPTSATACGAAGARSRTPITSTCRGSASSSGAMRATVRSLPRTRL
jgi:hypothetical protein